MCRCVRSVANVIQFLHGDPPTVSECIKLEKSVHKTVVVSVSNENSKFNTIIVPTCKACGYQPRFGSKYDECMSKHRRRGCPGVKPTQVYPSGKKQCQLQLFVQQTDSVQPNVDVGEIQTQTQVVILFVFMCLVSFCISVSFSEYALVFTVDLQEDVIDVHVNTRIQTQIQEMVFSFLFGLCLCMNIVYK